MPFRNQKRAFTLIELLAVIIIIVLLSGMMLPVFDSGLERARTRGNLGRIVQMANLCTSLSAEHREPYRLYIQPGEHRLFIGYQPDPREARGEFQPLRQSRITALQLDEDLAIRTVQFEAAPEQENKEEREGIFIEFHPDGTNDGGLIILDGRAGGVYTISISAMTGRVRLLDYDLLAKREELEGVS